jgi:iron complex transport system ATP-binding protein
MQLPPLLEFRNVTVRRGDRDVLDSVDLSIAQGENVAILGPNGSGKSTLTKLISRELYPLAKDGPPPVRILGSETWNLFDLRNHLGLVSNEWMSMCTRDFTGLEIVLSGFFGSVGVWPYHPVTAEMRRRALDLMDELEIGALAGRSTAEMSSGEARRVLIARALAHDPQALILDEPTNSLDLHATSQVRAILRRLTAKGISIVMVTHHLPDIIPEIRRVVTMRSGRILSDGTKAEALRPEALGRLFGVDVDVLNRNGYFYAL